MDARARGRGTTRRTLTPSTTFLITWRYTEAMSIGPDVLTPRTENTTSRPRAFDLSGKRKKAARDSRKSRGRHSTESTRTRPVCSEDTASM